MSSNHNLFPKNSPIGLLWLSLARSFLLVFIPAYTSCYPLTGTAGVFEYQPGPDSSQDIWTTSVYSYAPGGQYPGGGRDDNWLRIGGWGDYYHALLQFDLTGLPGQVEEARIDLFATRSNYNPNWSTIPTAMYLDRITEPWD
jgi:hypothetical protein